MTPSIHKEKDWKDKYEKLDDEIKYIVYDAKTTQLKEIREKIEGKKVDIIVGIKDRKESMRWKNIINNILSDLLKELE